MTYKLTPEEWARKQQGFDAEPTQVRETSISTGTGARVLAGAVSGYLAAATVYADGDVFAGAMTDGLRWEYGLYTYQAGTNSVYPSLIEGSSVDGVAIDWDPAIKTFVANVADHREALQGLLFEQLQDGLFWGSLTLTEQPILWKDAIPTNSLTAFKLTPYFATGGGQPSLTLTSEHGYSSGDVQWAVEGPIVSFGTYAGFSTSGNMHAAGFLPNADNTSYLGKNDDDDPVAFKGLILKDQGGTGKYYRLEVNGNVLQIVDLTD